MIKKFENFSNSESELEEDIINLLVDFTDIAKVEVSFPRNQIRVKVSFNNIEEITDIMIDNFGKTEEFIALSHKFFRMYKIDGYNFSSIPKGWMIYSIELVINLKN